MPGGAVAWKGAAEVDAAGDLSQDLYIDLLKRALTASIYDESAWRRLEASRSLKHRNPARPLRYAKSWLRSVLLKALDSRGLMVIEKRPYNPEDRVNGRDWPLFGYTMIGHRRLDNLQACVETVLRDNIAGDFIETGVWRGGATIFMRALLKRAGETQRIVWVANSFEGLPVPTDAKDGMDLSHVEILAAPLEQVKDNFARFGLLDEQVRFLKGWFADTLPSAPIKSLAILRLDGDLYSSTTDALEALYAKVSPGGFVIVDDYGTWPSCKRAVDDFLARNKLRVEIKDIDGTGVFWRVGG